MNGTIIASYTYDNYDRLLTETANGMTTSWTYDLNGSILTKSRNGNITEYKYEDSEWKDLLTSYNGQSITYDASGYRTSKSSNGVTTNYYLDGDRITAIVKGSEDLSFVYDEKGLIIGLYHNGTAYAYAKNLQGDIIGIIDAGGNWVVTYEYDAWGVPTSVSGELSDTLGQLNPFRYRGYCYDGETGLYYVSSRYYDPEIGRFINADTTDVLDVQGDLYDKNLYAYCDNNPVTRVDYSGKVWITVGIMAVGGAIGGVIGAVSSAVTQKSLTGTVNWKSVIVAGVGGFVSGAVAASPLGVTGQVVAGSIIGSLSYVADCKVNKKSVSMDELAVATLGGTVSGIIGGPGANQNMALTKTIQTSIKTTTRMSSRACTTYAAKQIVSTKVWRNNILTVNAMGSSARFAAGTGVSNVIASALSTVKGWFSKLFN